MVVERETFLKKGAELLHEQPFGTVVEKVPELVILLGIYAVMLLHALEEENDGHFN